MAKRFTDTDKYKKSFIRNLPASYKIFWDYLYHDCSFSGIWQVDFEIAQICVGKDAPINKDEALRLFNDGEERIKVLNNGSKWLIKPFIDFQYGGLNPANRVHASVLRELLRYGIRGLQAPFYGSKNKEKDKDKDRIPSCIEDVKTFFLSILNLPGVEAEKFYNHFTSNGWKVGGKAPMKNWKAAAKNWATRVVPDKQKTIISLTKQQQSNLKQLKELKYDKPCV